MGTLRDEVELNAEVLRQTLQVIGGGFTNTMMRELIAALYCYCAGIKWRNLVPEKSRTKNRPSYAHPAPGVYRSKNAEESWEARIQNGTTLEHLGIFTTVSEAATAVRKRQAEMNRFNPVFTALTDH